MQETRRDQAEGAEKQESMEGQTALFSIML